MSCCDEQGHHQKDDNSCVADILRQIVDAQDDIVDDDCDIGCEQSIQDLRGDTTAPNNLDTVPVLLYCKCEPFRGFGVRNDQNHTVLDSYFFRVTDVGRDNCATLELLRDPSDTQPGCVDPTKQKNWQLTRDRYLYHSRPRLLLPRNMLTSYEYTWINQKRAA